MAIENEKAAVNRTADRAGDIAGREGMQSGRWEEVFQGVNQPILILDPDHVILEANRAVQEATGLSEKDLRGKTCYQVFHDADEPPPGCPLVAMRVSGRPETSEMDVEILGRMFLVSVTPFFDEHGPLERIVHVATDITEHKRAEESLRQSEERFKELADLLPQTVFETDIEGNLTFVNQQAFYAFGYSREDFDKGIHALQTLIPGDRVRAKENIRRVLSGERIGGEEYTALRKDGSTFFIIIYCDSIIQESRPVGLRGIIIDITERKQAEESLRQSEERYRTMIENANDMIWMLDTEGRFTIYNHQAEIISGYKLEEWEGKSFAPLIHQDDLEMVSEVFRKTLSGEPQHYTVRCYKKSGELFILSINTTPVYEKGKVVGTVSFGRDITERRRAEEVLAHERDLLQALMDNMPDTIYFKDTASRFTRINKAQAQVLGVRDPQEVIGKTDSDFFADEHARAAYEDEQKMVETGEALIAKEEKVRRADGTFRWVSASKVPIKDAAGHVTGIVGISRDITKRKQVTDALRESEGRYRTLVEGLEDVIVSFLPDGTISYCSPNVKDFGGYDPEEEIGHHFSKYIADEKVKQQLRELFQEITRIKKPVTFEFLYRPKIKAPFYVEATASPIISEKTDEIVSIQCIVRDITERKRSEEQLRTERDKAQQYLDVAGVMIIALDAHGEITLINTKGCEILGYGQKEILGKNWFDGFLPRGRVDKVKSVYGKLMKGEIEQVEYYENPIRTKTGEERIIAWHNSLLRDATGRIIGLLSSGEDITEHKRLEAQLLQAQKMEAVGHLAGGVAHDFNNILTVILGYAAFIQRTLSSDDELFQNLEQIRKAGERAAVLTRQLLAFSRQQIMQPKDLNINEVVDGLLKMIRRVIGEDMDLQFISGRQLGTVHADPGQIEQVLMNLCVNARDAMPQGGTLTLETENVLISGAYRKTHPWANEGRYVLISVTDTGHGMDEETRSQVFEPFFTTKEVGKGTGLGLATVYGIVKQHDGMINVYSEVGKGTTFKVYLPIVERPAEEVGNKIEGPARGGTETLLFAEDHESLRRMTVELLETAGYTVLVATDGQEAVEVFEAHADQISLVLLDVVMPKLSGRDASDRIRAIKPDVRTLYTSGYSANAIHTRFVLDEGIELIQKPYDMQVLLRKIREALDRK